MNENFPSVASNESIQKPEISLDELSNNANIILSGESMDGKTAEEVAAEIRFHVNKNYDLAKNLSTISSEKLAIIKKYLDLATKLEDTNKEKKDWHSTIETVESGRFDKSFESKENNFIKLNAFCCVSSELFLGEKIVRRINEITIIYSIDKNDERASELAGSISYRLPVDDMTWKKRKAIEKAQDDLQQETMGNIELRAGEKIYSYFSVDDLREISENVKKFVLPKHDSISQIYLYSGSTEGDLRNIGSQIAEQAEDIIESISKTVYVESKKVASISDGGKRYAR